MAVFQAGQRITAATLNSFCAPLEVIKPSDQSVTSSTVLVNDNALVLPVVASATYDFTCYLNYESLIFSSSGGLKFEWTVPTGATLRFGMAFLATGGTDSSSVTFSDSTAYSMGGRGAASLCAAVMTGSLVMSSTAGNLQLEWAQVTSSATATIVHAQSFVRLWRIS